MASPSRSPPASNSSDIPQAGSQRTKWTDEEHDRFLAALELYPKASWKAVAEIVGTRSSRQVMSHAQKYKQKKHRHLRGLKAAGRPRQMPVSPTSVEGVEAIPAKPSRRHRTSHQYAALYEHEVHLDSEPEVWSLDELAWFAELVRLKGW